MSQLMKSKVGQQARPYAKGGAVAKKGDSAKTAKASKTSTATKTATSTDAYTQGNVTVTGGAGRGATTTVHIATPKGKVPDKPKSAPRSK